MYPKMFELQPQTRERLLELLKGDRIKLRKYPDLIKAMFGFDNTPIPEDLQVEENY